MVQGLDKTVSLEMKYMRLIKGRDKNIEYAALSLR